MATSAELFALDAAHRVQQAANARDVAVLILTYWALVNRSDLAGTGGPWLDRSIRAIGSGHRTSGLLSLAYVRAVRELQVPRAPAWTPPPLEPLNLEAVRESLIYTGIKTAAVGLAKVPREQPAVVGDPEVPLEQALQQADRVNQGLEVRRDRVMEAAGKAAVAAAVRHVRNGGRSAVDAAIASDRVALGFVRITREDPCYFCAALASRGPVYEEDSFAESDPRFEGPGEHKVHDSCGCTLRPVYTRSREEWPEQARTFEELWKSGDGTMKGFRKLYEGR